MITGLEYATLRRRAPVDDAEPEEISGLHRQDAPAVIPGRDQFESEAAYWHWRQAEAKKVHDQHRTRPRLTIAGIGVLYGLPHQAAAGATWDEDMFEPGCFSGWLSERKTDLHRMHQHNFKYGSTDSGNLRLSDAPDGLNFKFTVDAEDVRAMRLFDEVASRKMHGVSVGFFADGFEIRQIEGKTRRVITDARLGELSIVDCPAVPGTLAVALDEAKCGGLWFVRSAAAFRVKCVAAQFQTQLRRLAAAVAA